MIKNGEWYADLGRGVVCGKLTMTDNGETFSCWTEESAELFRYVKVKPAAEDPAGEEPEGPTDPQPQRPGLWKRIVSFFLRLVDFFKKILSVGG